jgi:thiol-disulfide isomerase/thioredoxin
MLAAAMIVLATGCSATGADEPTRSAGQQGYVGVEQNLTRIPVDQREPAPVISGPQLGSDRTLSTAAYADKVVVVNVWGSWCPPCRSEAPDLQAASEQTKHDAQFVGVTSRDLDPAPAEAFLRAAKIGYPSIYDPSGKVLLGFARDLPPSAIPSTMIIDKQGRLAARVLGPTTKATLVGMVTDIAVGK